MAQMKWPPTLRGARLLLKQHKPSAQLSGDAREVRYGALVLPQTAEFTDVQAEVVSVGDTVRDARLRAGVKVLCRKTGRSYVEEGLWLCYEGDVLAIVEEG